MLIDLGGIYPLKTSPFAQKKRSSSKTFSALRASGRNTTGGEAQKAGKTRCM